MLKPSEPAIDHPYEQNQRLGYRINYLTDQNNYYRITINNIKKLNHNINKHLQTANQKISKNKNQHNVVDPRTVGQSYMAITNKIHLKNLQMKVGNMKRRVDKFQKIHGGSITSLQKQSELMQKQINVLSRQFQFYTIQNILLDNLYLDDYLISKINAQQASINKPKNQKRITFDRTSQIQRTKHRESGKIGSLEEMNLRFNNKFEQLLKEEKDLKEQKMMLARKIQKLREERQKLASQIYPKNFNIRIAQASQIQRLQSLSLKQTELQSQINKQDMLLQQQYKINQQYKQKILDRNELEVKDIKGLQQKIKKRKEQVRDIKSKCQHLEQTKSKNFIKNK